MMDGNIEQNYLWEMAYLEAEREHREWNEWCEYQQSLQKPAKIEVLIENGEKVKGELQEM